MRRLLGAARQGAAESRAGRMIRHPSALPPHLLDRDMLEAASRAESRAVYLGQETVLCRVLGKYLMYADAQETGITPHLCMDGYWESWITVALARTVRPGWHCLDVGANHGYYTLIMADAVGREGRVIPVEPTPRLADLLRQTLDVNGFPYVTVAAEAASDTNGETLQLVIPPRRSMNARVAHEAGPNDMVVEVKSVTIDALTRDWPRVDLIKIDVEGAEESVWRGMERTIAESSRLVVILEFNVERYDDARRIPAALHRLRRRGEGHHRRPATEPAGRRRLDALSGPPLTLRTAFEAPDLLLQLANAGFQLVFKPLTHRDFGGEPGFDVRDRLVCLASEIVEHVELQPQDDALDKRDHRTDDRLRREAELRSKPHPRACGTFRQRQRLELDSGQVVGIRTGGATGLRAFP
jgi:FkbM family methyltransferase